jgi:hypothetical protein
MIYFWNDKQLARDLKNSAISEWYKFIYFLLYLYVPKLIESLESFAPKHHPLESSWILLILIIGFFIGIWLFYILYKTNAKGDGVHFIERYVCLTFPLIIRFSVIGIPIILLASLPLIMLLNGLGFEAHSSGLILAAIIVIPFLTFYYLRLLTLLKIASGQRD